MLNKIIMLIVIMSTRPVLAENKDDKFPWLMKAYKHIHLTKKEKSIYRYAFFETFTFLLYGRTPNNDEKYIKLLNYWIEMVEKTKDDQRWSPNMRWMLGDDADKSVAFILKTHCIPLMVSSNNPSEGGSAIPKSLRLCRHADWKRWSIKEKSIYVAGYIDTVATLEMDLKNAGMKNNLRELQIIIEAYGIEGVLSDILKTQFIKKHPLPWSVSKGLGKARERMFSDKIDE